MRAGKSRAATPELPLPGKSSQEPSGDARLEPLGQHLSSPSLEDYSIALSETDTLDPGSPDIPPLSAPPRLELAPQTPASVSKLSNLNSDQTFYTASWGSPYDASLLPAGRHRTSSLVSLDDLDEDSPNIQFGLSHLIPSRLTSTYEVTPTRPSTPNPPSPTDETPRSASFFNTDLPPLESRNLTSAFAKYLRSRVDRRKGSGERQFNIQESSPTKAFNTEREVPQLKGHPSREKNRTLRQEDITPSLSRKTSGMESSRFASSTRREGDPATPSLSSQASPVKPALSPSTSMATPPTLGNRTTSSTSVGGRTKKKIVYKGKTCWISFPPERSRGGQGEAPTPLSASEVDARLKRFEDAGYDIRGFGNWKGLEEDVISTVAQNCPVYPDPADVHAERQNREFRIKIPNRSDWEAYVNFLTEQKLAALGVTVAAEPEEPVLSRQTSSQFGQPFSPPVPTSSAGSHRVGPAGNAYPAGFVPGSSNHTSTRSIASPISSLGNPRVSHHMHRHSVFSSPPNAPQQAISPLGFTSFSPQSLTGQNIAPSSGSPAFSSGAADLRSPISPFGSMIDSAPSFPFAQRDELWAQLQRQQQQQIINQQQQQQLAQKQQQQQELQQRIQQQPQPPLVLVPMRPASTLEEVPEVETEDDSQPSQARSAPPEIVTPKPGHRHNISAKLEENVNKLDYNFKKPSEKPVEEAATPASTEGPVPEWRRNAPTTSDKVSQPEVEDTDLSKHMPSSPPELPKDPVIVGRTYGLEYENEPPTSDIEVDTSEIENPKPVSSMPENDPMSHSDAANEIPSSSKRHSSKLSFSGFNVEAKEFNPTANPRATFNPSIFNPSSFVFNPERVHPFVPQVQNSSTTSTPASKGAPKSTFNINAPSFSPSGFGGSNLSKSEFSFSSKVPSFNPAAPSFQPGSSILSSDQSFSSPASDSSSRIFSNINFSDLIPPPKEPKAVPIVVPDPEEREVGEDEAGRPQLGNSKRARRGGIDDDDVPLFAVPSDTAEARMLSKSISQMDEASGVNELSSTLILDDEPEARVDRSSKSDDTARPVHVAAESPQFPAPERLAAERSPDIEAVENKVLLHSLTQDDGEPDASSTPEYLHTGRLLSETTNLSPFAAPFEPQEEDSVPETPSRHHRPDLKERRASDSLISPPSSVTPFRSDGDYLDMQVEHVNRPLSSPPGRNLPSSVRYYDDAVDQPTFFEIDAVMQRMNEEGSDFGVERNTDELLEREREKDTQSWPGSSSAEEPATLTLGLQPELPMPLRSDAPSPSPRRGLLRPALPVEGDSGSVTHDPFSDTRGAIGYDSPIHRPSHERQISDWTDFASGDEQKILSRAPFVHSHVSQLINGALDVRLSPLEKHLQSIQEGLASISVPRSSTRMRSRAPVDSDADDEDDDVDTDFHSRAFSRSPIRDRKMEKLRAIIQDALANHRRSHSPETPGTDLSRFMEALEDMRSAMTQSSSQTLTSEDVRGAVGAALVEQKLVESIQASVASMIQLDDLKAAVEAAITQHPLTLASSRAVDDQDNTIMSELLQKNAEAVARAAEEAEARKFAERREAEAQRLLKLAEEELSLFKSTSTDESQRLRAFEARAKANEDRLAEVEATYADLKEKNTSLAQKNAALDATLEEYRLSHSKWREDIDNANREKEKLAGAFGALKLQADEAIRIRETMRDRLEKLQVDTSNTSAKLADERSRWQRQDAEHRTRYELLQHRITAESRTRERIEKEMERLEVQEREAMKLRHVLDHMQQEKARMQADIEALLAKEREAAKMSITLSHYQKENAKFEEQVESLRNERDKHQRTAEKYAREHNEAREAARLEVQRTTMAMQADVERANHQVNIIRAELEAEVSRLRADLDNAKMEIDTAKAKHELLLEQEEDARRDAIHEVIEGKTAALAEQKRFFEERLEEMRKQQRRDLDHVIENKNQSETFLREAHSQRQSELEQIHQRAIAQAAEDRERLETDYNSRLALSGSKIELLEDKISHLEQKLEISKSAAQAAAQAAQSAKAPVVAPSSFISPVARNQGGLSSQALRESITVLQDQLQERESRIETLETELAAVDKDLPEKLKGRDVEVGWLRELLGVRIDDLNDLVTLLDRDDFDRESVRNAAIRIRTGLQMEQHDKERLKNGSSGPLSAVPSNLAASLQSFASPRAAQLAKVIGEWRNNSTPSRSSPGSQTQSSFLAGLMTPPASNIRRGSSTSSAAGPSSLRPSAAARHNKGKAPLGLRAMPSVSAAAEEDDDLESEPPRTPPLLEREGYDHDAEAGRFSASGFYDDEESTVEGTPRRDRTGGKPLSGDFVRP
jgi:hypothetical protein